ncbi:tRNA pseudouridine(55) synthase TruB [Candidatus Hepatoplasma crinochetorum]|uniref:tRNA pseudouridine(55) synthase TruB n=1 Tax=Candidatus Hepatoplasma crinochetorum TaxID=295596 RepID=UPI0030923C8D|nr:MAG: hypothetical protein HCTKY_1720 [Candidatus Hepatoplasma crinochetorum]
MDAIFLAFKESGISSNKFIQKIKKNLNLKKIGHSGTLDPFASGILLIGTGNYTKLLHNFNNLDKTYQGTILFGKETDTLDITGKILKEEIVNLDIKKIKKEIKDNFIGDISQVPPIFSAIKIKGKPAYKYAIKGKNIDLEAKKRFIYYFNIYETDKNNEFNFEIKVSSGTYIRSIARDLSFKLNSIAIIKDLKRIKIGNLKIEDPYNKIEKIEDPYEILKIKKIELNIEKTKEILDGKKIEILDYDDLILLAYNKKNNNEIFIQKINKNTYKIKKRIK